MTKALGRVDKWPSLKATLWEHGTKIIWLRRRNVLQQALAEYNSLVRNHGKAVRGAANRLDGEPLTLSPMATSVLNSIAQAP